MPLGTYLSRELITSVRRGRIFRIRVGAVLLVAAAVACGFAVWDSSGWDRASVAAAARFGLQLAGLVIFAQVCLAIPLVTTKTALAIAQERERKSLDSLLATRLSSAEIVLGTLAANLMRYANGLAATVPVVVFVTCLGGIEPRLVLLAGAGLASTVFLLAAHAIAVSAESRTARRAAAVAVGSIAGWIAFPLLVLLIKPMLWPNGPRWLVTVALWLLETSPMAVAVELAGVVPQPGGLFEVIGRMSVLETAGGAMLLAWAIARLRPASRALYDIEGRISRTRQGRAAMRKWNDRPACGDDPVFWNEIYSSRGCSPAARVAGWLVLVTWIGLLSMATSWFAVPAFQDVASRGYGAAPGALAASDENPFARVLVNPFVISAAVRTVPGQARSQFNAILRQFSTMFSLLFVLSIAASAASSVETERRRDTWLSLLATPLTGWEILGGKLRGAIWRAHGYAVTLVSLWMVGLLAGALHPLGLLAAIAALASSGGFSAALGISMAFRAGDANAARNGIHGTFSLLARVGGELLVATGPPILIGLSLFSYDDVFAVLHRVTYSPVHASLFDAVVGARTVVAAALIGIAALSGWALALVRDMNKRFDAAVGRPARKTAGTRANAHAILGKTWLNRGEVPSGCQRGS